MMNNFIKQAIDESVRSRREARYSYSKKGDRSLKRKDHYKDETEEQINATTPFDDKTLEVNKDSSLYKKNNSVMKSNTKEKPFSTKSNKVKEPIDAEVDEVVDADGNIATGDMPGNPNAFIRSKRTSDQVAKTSMGMMGSFGVLGGNSSGNKTLKYWAESDMSKALGADETIMDPGTDYEDAVEHFEDDLEVDPDEAKERAEKMGYDKSLPDGKIRLIENPKKYIEEYLAKKAKPREFVKKSELECPKRNINPILLKQLASIKQSLKNNGLTSKDITEYLEDYNE